MPRFHHANLGVPPHGVDSEAKFLTDILGYRRADLDDRMRALGAQWFDADDGTQIHLSEDAEHRPAARAHTAVEFGAELVDVERRLEQAAIEFDADDRPDGGRVLRCLDPAGNTWELRGSIVTV